MGNADSDLKETKCWNVIKWIPGGLIVYGVPRWIVYKIIGSRETEMERWKVVKWIPLVNLAYGLPRLIVYICKGDLRQSVDTAVTVGGGILGIVTGTWACGLFAGTISQVSPQLLATFCKFAVEMIVGGIAEKVMIGGGDILATAIFEPEELKGKSPDEIETLLYNKIMKDIPFAGAIYSLPRAVVYHLKENNDESLISLNAFTANIVGSTLACTGAAALAPHAHEACSKLFECYEDDLARFGASLIEKSITNRAKTPGIATKLGIEKFGDNSYKVASKAKYI